MSASARCWIVTGANGYLGGALCKGLHARGAEVVALARGGRSMSGLEAAGIRCGTYGVPDGEPVEGSVFVHCAGKVSATGQWDDYVRTNVEWPVELYERAAAAGAECFIYVSSIAALGYGNRPGAPVLDEQSEPQLDEGELYGRSKLLAEQRLTALAAGQRTRLVILRPGLIYDRDRMKSNSTWFRRGSVVDLRQRVPLVHIDNFLDSVLATAAAPSACGVFIVVDDEQPELGQLNAMKERHGLLRYRPWCIGPAGFRLLNVLKGAARVLRGRPPGSRGYASAQYLMSTRRSTYRTDRLREETGWSPAVGLEAGLGGTTAPTAPVTTGRELVR